MSDSHLCVRVTDLVLGEEQLKIRVGCTAARTITLVLNHLHDLVAVVDAFLEINDGLTLAVPATSVLGSTALEIADAVSSDKIPMLELALLVVLPAVLNIVGS